MHLVPMHFFFGEEKIHSQKTEKQIRKAEYMYHFKKFTLYVPFDK
jgi:hypothetical protein